MASTLRQGDFAGMRRIFTLVLVAAVLEIRTPCDAAFLERGSQQPLQYNLRHPDKVEPEVSNCENCTWRGTNATLSASRPHQRARKLTNEIATARKRIEQKLIVLESLQNAAVALGVASKDSPLSQLTVSHYEDFFANSSNAKFLFGETPADASFLQTEELPYDNLWHFHGVPGKKCEAKCMQVREGCTVQGCVEFSNSSCRPFDVCMICHRAG